MKKRMSLTFVVLSFLVLLLGGALALGGCTTADSQSSESEPLASSQPSPKIGSSAQEVEVTTASGPIKGTSVAGISTYKGIPYAKAPVGDLRFAPPQDAEPWTDTLDCTEFGPTPLQANALEGQAMAEDCLSLNVWTSANAQSTEKMPVYVWIYGGAFAIGAGSQAAYDGTNYANEGIVFVTFNYRINALGFYASQASFDAYGTTGNWGLLDQIKALEWVQENIAAFGGDPNNVTIGGESAGSYSASALILSPLAEGLFHKAIMESGTILGVPGNNSYSKGDLERTIELNNMFNKSFDVTADDAQGLAKMREADAGELVQLSTISFDLTANTAYQMLPCYDGYVLPKDPVRALAEGKYHKVKVLLGYNANEGSIFIPEASEDAYHMIASREYGADKAAQVIERFPVSASNDATQRAREQIAYGMFTTGMITYADYLSDAGLDVYAYNFRYVTKESDVAGLGASHGSEIAFAFNNMATDAPKAEKQYAQEVFIRWVNFIKNGDPNEGTTPPSKAAWPKYTTDTRESIIFENYGVSSGTIPGIEDQLFMKDIMYDPNDPYYR